MIVYRDTIEGIAPAHLTGFFVGWPNPPSPETHLRKLENSQKIVIAIDDGTSQVVGYINVLTAFIPGLEVLPEYQGRGIGSQLVTQMIEKLSSLYSIDLMCDPDVEPFYERLGFAKGGGMVIRNFANQSGIPSGAGNDTSPTPG